jgi:hypothetical protein
MSTQLPNELQKLADDFMKMRSDAGNFFAKLNDSKFNKRPANNGWSIAECIDHLIVTGDDYCNKFEEALKIAAEKDLRKEGDYRYSWFGKRFISFVEPPVRIKVKSPKKWRPDSGINRQKASAAYLQLQDRWVDLITGSVGWDITKVKLPSPASDMIKFTAFEILAVNAAHQHRHFQQAIKVFEEIK